MDDTHDELVKAYLEYFKANEAWERKKSVRKYYAVQQCTKKIKKISHQRNLEIREEFYNFKKETKKK
jgi:hypothetical protein